MDQARTMIWKIDTFVKDLHSVHSLDTIRKEYI